MKTFHLHSFLLLAVLGLWLAGCSDESSSERAPFGESPNQKLNVVSTTMMLHDAVRVIGGEQVSARSLMGPGVDPHLYKATQGDLKKLKEADLIFYNGLYLEGKLGEVFKSLKRRKPVFAVAEDAIAKTELLASPVYEDAYDPHVWFDVSLWKQVVQELGDRLAKADTSHAALFLKRTAAYSAQLDSLHAVVQAELATIPEQQRVLITAHDAFHYFGRAYTIQVKGLQGISTVTEPGLKDVSDLTELIVNNQIKAVFVETSVSEKMINAVVEGCRRQGHEVVIGGYLYSDAMGEAGSGAGTYIGMVHTNVSTIVNALN